MISRRTALLSAVAAAVGVSLALRRGDPVQKEIHAVLEREFGSSIAGSEAATEFVADVQRLHQADGTLQIGQATLILSFLRTTTVVRALETGETPIYLGAADPLEMPCSNPLSAAWL